ncbi:hypothetical protein FALBO_4861 [Fusarium albosuccineum]|uniref:Uncharacterized protein n=1 Tax=Fusarium albosuccineum TaxID=1237068 RepID=A0A8H4PKL4_9HYPO|nr:hypothetical protein FALBO_4861 [Fusarium albosuccineum]
MSRQVNLQRAINKLNIGDSLALKEAFAGDVTVERCHRARTNPSGFLSKTFRYPITLLSVMFDTGCVISGSRALDFFIPGSANIDSDWDFYVPGYKESVADMVNVLSLCGVTWESEVDTISSTLLRDGQVEVSSKVLEALLSWIPNSNSEVSTELMGDTIHEILQSFKSLKPALRLAKSYAISRSVDGEVIINPSADKVTYEDSYESCTGESFNMMHGSIETPRGIQSIQLIIGCHYEGIRSCLSFIKDFYASHVQCFIGGWCAAHLYYYHANSKRAVLWQRSRTTTAIEKAIKKYENRGFSFQLSTPDGPVIRRLNDDSSMFIDYGDIYEAFVRKSNLSMLNNWLADRRRNIETIHWVEFQGKIFTMNSPLETCARRRFSFATEKFKLPLVRIRRLADIISLNTTESDHKRTKSYYSSVRKTISGTEWTIREAARSGGVYRALHDANPWSWTM